jgi:hypothetical protein
MTIQGMDVKGIALGWPDLEFAHGGSHKPPSQEERCRPGPSEKGLSCSVREKAFFFSCFVVWGQKAP